MSLSDPLPRPASTLRRDAWDGNHEVERDPPGNPRALERGDIAMGEGGLPLPGQNETQKSLSGNPLPRPGAGAVMAISGGKPCPGAALTAVSRSDTGFPGGGGAGVLPFPAEGCPYLFTPGVIAACPAYRRVDLIPAGYLLSPKPRDVLPEILRRPRGPAAPSRIIPNPENSINTGSTSIPPLTGPDNP